MHHIVYILGSTRSGTSALRNAICRTRYNGYGEGHMEGMLAGIIAAVQQHRPVNPANQGNARSKMKATKLLRHLFLGYERYLSKEVNSQFMVDKSPSVPAILAAPAMNRYHANAKFIHCARRHVDNVHSKLKKFPSQTFQQSCKTWAKCNSAWLDVREQLDGNYVDFDFHDLANDPEAIVARIAAYLELDQTEAEAMLSYLQSQRPEAKPERDVTRFLKLSEVDWPEADKKEFVRICGPVGEKLGYGMESYFETDT